MLLWTHFLKVSCWHMILLVLLYSFQCTVKLRAILLLLAKKILHPHFFGISKSTWLNVWAIRSTYKQTYESTYITETFTKLSWALDKVDENNINLVEKYFIRATKIFVKSFCASDINWLQFLLFRKSNGNKLRSFPQQKRHWSFIFRTQSNIYDGTFLLK